MALNIARAAELAYEDSSAIARALGSAAFMADPKNLKALKTLNGAAEEMDRAGDLGLAVAFTELKLLTTAEGLFGKFGKKGTIYTVGTVIDASNRPFEYKQQFFHGIKRGEKLPFGDGGMVVTFMKNPKWFIDIHLLVMESDSDAREVGKAIEKARKEADLDGVVGAAASLLSFDPTGVGEVAKAVDIFAAALAYLLKKNGDDHIATIHDFYLKHQGFGVGRHPKRAAGAPTRTHYQGVEAAYEISLSQL